MSQPLDFRARSVSEIVDAAFQLYRRDALQYILAAAVAYAPVLILQTLLFGGMDLTRAASMSPALLLPSYVVALVGYLLMKAVLVHYSAGVYLGRGVDLGASVRAVLPRLPAILVAGLLSWALIALGLVLLIVPGLILFTRFFAVIQVLVLEPGGVGNAISRSMLLSRERKMHIFGTLALVYFIYFIGSMALGVVGSIALFMTGTQIITMILGGVYAIVAYPIIGIAEMVLYYDARIRAEAYDVELMAGGLSSPATSVPAL